MALSRDLFFDELFTAWITKLSFGGILVALRHDSGPPLYYFVVHVARLLSQAGGADSGRAVALLAGVASVAMLASVRRLGSSRFVAAIFLATLPVHAYYSTEARAYSLAALAVGAGVLSLTGWIESGRRSRLALGTAFLLAAAYTHYDAVLLFPLPLVLAAIGGPGRSPREPDRRKLIDGLLAAASLGVAFIPGFLLMRVQPVKYATEWMSLAPSGPHSFALPLTFAGPFSSMIVRTIPLFVSFLVLIPTLLLLAAGLRSWLGRAAAAATLMPLLFALVLAAAGINVYFPFRFESILSVSFVLWLAAGVAVFPIRIGAALVAILSLAGATVCLRSAAEPNSPDPFHIAAVATRSLAPPGETIVATGYSYLEVAALADEGWSPHLAAFPAEQADHPGWRASKSAGDLDGELARASQSWGKEWIWIGEIGSPEQRAMARATHMHGVFQYGGVGVARASR